MKRKSYVFVVLILIMMLGISQPVLADKFTDTIEIYKKSEAVKPFFKSAYGYAVFPTIGKGGRNRGRIRLRQGVRPRRADRHRQDLQGHHRIPIWRPGIQPDDFLQR